MRALLPQPQEQVDLESSYAVADSTGGDPFVRLNMISSLDGAIAIRGRSGQLGGPADRRLFHLLRSLADLILVGAGTARAEGYGPARVDDDVRARRRARGQPEVPPIALVTRSCHLDWASPFFTEAEARPVIVTTGDADEQATGRASTYADVVTAGTTSVDLAAALRTLAERGARHILVEGGPGLNAQLAAAGLLDEICLTLSPRVVGGDGPRLLAGAELENPLELEPVHLLEEDGFFFLRLRRRPARDAR